jgi:hypothetical protein
MSEIKTMDWKLMSGTDRRKMIGNSHAPLGREQYSPQLAMERKHFVCNIFWPGGHPHLFNTQLA